MDAKFIDALSTNDLNRIQELARVNPNILSHETPEGNTPLHLAVRHEWWACANKLCDLCPLTLFARTNTKGQTPIHLAATAGRLTFLTSIRDKAREDEEQGGVEALRQMVKIVDANGDNALHLALRNNHNDVAAMLIELDGQVLSDLMNTKCESPLYLAARRSMSGIVKRLLEFKPSNHGGPGNQTALHAAAMQGDTDSASELLDKKPELDKVEDKNMQIPLHHAVYWGNIDMIKFLLQHDRFSAYHKDKDGNLPIHIAAQLNNVRTFTVLYWKVPDSVDAENNVGENVLHMAIRSSTTGELVRFIGMKKVLRRLINHQDKNGNTPLHLAVIEKKFHRDYELFLQSEEVDPWVRNNEGNTAIDLFSTRREELSANELELFLKLFKDHLTVGKDRNKLNLVNLDTGVKEKDLIERFEKHASNLSLVATIMATITFGAAFTMPGGYDQNSGKVMLAQNTALRVFLISDTISMCCSLLVAYLFSSSKILRSPTMFHQNYAIFARYMMQLSFVGMMIAFAAGMYAAMPSNSRWVGNALVIICSAIPFVSYIIDNFMDKIESSINPVVELNVWVYGGLPSENKEAVEHKSSK